ncbi:MAG: TIGR00159 family protein [Ruminococcaceae bacterium]|nr:TIGR00159 family protein [Oscillospiraceae bacterium]
MLEILKIAIDILSLAAILFFIYRFAVKRRALKLAMGVVLFLLVMLIVDAAELTALGFVFGDFRQLGVIAILIIFQPELRSALEKIGGTTYEGIQNINHAVEKPTEANSHKIIDAIASAAQDLSKINYGALIVIERENSLEEYKAGGAYLDGAVTADALKSIFYKGATLHDGAVIIRNSRIEYARCVLPMTSRVDISSELGTRHRAALGTTEKTDAIVIIVSEESGIISMSVDGELERGYTYSTLCARLDELLNPDRKNKKKKRRRNHTNRNTKKNDSSTNGSNATQA